MSRALTAVKQDDGTYLCEYTPALGGAYVVDVEIDGYGVKGNPFSVLSEGPQKSEGDPNAKSEAGGSGSGTGIIKKGWLNKQVYIYIYIYIENDIFINIIFIVLFSFFISISSFFLHLLNLFQGGVRKNWKKRYFELDDKALSYYTDVGGGSLGTIPVNEIKGAYPINNLKVGCQPSSFVKCCYYYCYYYCDYYYY